MGDTGIDPASNVPVYAPLYARDLKYGSDDIEIASVLVAVPEAGIRSLLAATPFEFVSPHAWIDVAVFRSSFGIDPFGNAGVIIPARYRDTVGGFYAFCYVDTDESLALGREPWGYPKKYGTIHLQKTGRAVTASIRRKDAWFEISVVVDGVEREPPQVARAPFLLLQVLPSAESRDVLLKRVIARDTDRSAKLETSSGEGAMVVRQPPQGNELAWLEGCRPVAASYARGAFRGVYGRILGVEEVGDELRRALSPGRG